MASDVWGPEAARRLLFKWWHHVRDGTLTRAEFQDKVKPLRAQVADLLRQAGACTEQNSKLAGLAKEILKLEGAMCQHDFDGNRIFQHRFRDKWSLTHTNRSIPGFHHEATCRRYLRELRRLGTCLQPLADPQ